MVHLSVQKFSTKFKQVYKRNNFSTPKNYLDFIKNYMTFLSDKRRLFDSMVRRLEGGLTTLAKAQKDTEILSQQLEVQNAEIAKKQIVVQELIDDITAKSEIAAVQQKEASEKKEYLDKQSVIIAKEEKEAAIALEEAIPALEAAKLALGNVNKASLDEIKALPNPPTVILDVCAVCFFLYPKTSGNPDWPAIKAQVLMDMKLLENLKTYNVEKTRPADAANAKKRIQKILKDNKEIPPEEMAAFILKQKSQAAGGLYSWCESTLKCYDINKEVEPKKIKAATMKAQKEKGEKELAETEANLKALNESLAILNAKKKENQDELNELQRKSAEMTRKLNAASQLITGLGSEQTRWSHDMEQIKIDKIKLVGDCLTGSAFLSYCGPFNSVLRQEMIFETWK